MDRTGRAERQVPIRERDELRYPLRARAFITSGSGEEVSLHLRDISRSGFAARGLTPLPEGCRIVVELPGTPPAEAEVVWSIGCSLGARFLPKLPFSQVAALLQVLGDEAAKAADLTGRVLRQSR